MTMTPELETLKRWIGESSRAHSMKYGLPPGYASSRPSAVARASRRFGIVGKSESLRSFVSVVSMV